MFSVLIMDSHKPFHKIILTLPIVEYCDIKS